MKLSVMRKVTNNRGLTDFTRDEINFIDHILFQAFQYRHSHTHSSVISTYHIKNGKNKVSKAEHEYSKSIVRYLIKANFLDGKAENFNISSKGKIICEQGGIIPIYEKEINEKRSSKRYIISLVVSIAAIIISVLTAIFK